jgi:ABC-type Na+ transport system ATPase subunit NatA
MTEPLGSFANTLQLGGVLEMRAGDRSDSDKRKLGVALSRLGAPPIAVIDEWIAGFDA